MSFLAKMFGGGKKDSPTISTTEAIQKLRETEDMLLKKQTFLEGKINIELQNAKKYGMANKRAALQALKRKKRYEKQLQQIDGTLTTIEMQREALEGANTNTAVLKSMNDAAKALKSAHDKMDIDQVQDMMDDIAEQQDISKEISDAISNPVAFGQDIDDDELEKELEELEQNELDKELLGIGELPATPFAEPAVPSKPSKVKHIDDTDKELEELKAWCS